MKRFPFNLSDEQYEDFYRLFPDHGQRTRILRKCVQVVIRNAREKSPDQPSLIPDDAVGKIIKEENLI